MKIRPTGELMLVHLPGTCSLLVRTWRAYRELLPNLLALTALFGVGGFLNIVIQDGLTAMVAGSSVYAQGTVKVINTLLNIAISGFYFSFLFAAMVYLVHYWKAGKRIQLDDALRMASEKYVSLFVVGFILFLVMNGGLLGVVMPLFFTIWFYFALYAVLLDGDRGVVALAKSRYLTHGLFFRVFGRYSAILLLLFAAFSLLTLLLVIPVVGWALFVIAVILLAFFAFPFFIVYEYYRYEDVAAVQRNVPFHLYAGERWGIITWAILGLIISISLSSYDVIGQQGRARFTETVIVRMADVILPATNEWTQNIERSSGIMEKLRLITPRNDTSTPSRLDIQ
jgi:hypothetical protein